MVESLTNLRPSDVYPLDCDFLGYVNGDILLDSRLTEVLTMVQTARESKAIQSKVLLVGRRTNSFTSPSLKIEQMTLNEYQTYIQDQYIKNEQFMGLAMDYFVFSPQTFGSDFLSSIVVGRDMIDSYIFHYAFTHEDVTVIDCSQGGIYLILHLIVVIAIHQTGKEGNWGNKHSVTSKEDDQWNTMLIHEVYGKDTVLAKTTFLSDHKLSRLIQCVINQLVRHRVNFSSSSRMQWMTCFQTK